MRGADENVGTPLTEILENGWEIIMEMFRNYWNCFGIFRVFSYYY